MIAVTGATGNIGRTLVNLMVEAGEPVVALSRTAAQTPAGATRRLADLGDPASLNAALHGVKTLFLLVAGDDPRAILDTANSAGVGKVVLLSSQGAGTRPEAYTHPAAFEAAVKDSGLDWTILRPTGFASNAYQWAESIRTARAAAAPFGDIALPVIDPSDIAEVAAAVLRQDGHSERVYELTGPEAVTPRQQVATSPRRSGTASPSPNCPGSRPAHS